LKVQNHLIENSNITANKNLKSCNINKNSSTPAFKAAVPVDGALYAIGGLMQWIQNQGFLASFLIQDVLGMTAPRVGAAFLRDKEVTGKYNVQEGFEVLGREGLTGPCMMAVAPLMFLMASKIGRTTGVNSRLIKRFGNSLKEMVANPNLDKNLMKNKEQFKTQFYKQNIEKMLTDTLGKENVSQEGVSYLMEQLSKFETTKGKVRNEAMNNIVEYINNIKFSTSTELNKLGQVKIGSKEAGTLADFSIKEAFEGLIKYSDDAITSNKNLENLNEATAENIKNSAVAKRFLTNISTMAATLGVMSVLPKIYAKSDIAPGAATAMQLREKSSQEQISTQEVEKKQNSVSQVSFKGKGEPIMSKFGRWISTFMKDGWAKELEYNGHNFTNTLMTGLSLGGLLAPRGYRAYSRAQVDENGKKDLSELWEILIRDVSSSLSVVFLVPMLTRAFVNSYESQSGFVLMNKDRTKNGWSAIKDLLNPYSSSHVMSNAELNALYNGVNSKEKMINFCEFITKNNGDLYKILSKSEELTNLVKDKKIDLDLTSMKNLSKAERNSRLSAFFKELGNDGKIAKDKIDDVITQLMKGAKNGKVNKIAGFAKGLNSVPAIITTFLISPYVLGWVIPRFTYANTRRLHAEAEEKRKQNAINA